MSRYGCNKLLSQHLCGPNKRYSVISVNKQFYRHPFRLDAVGYYWLVGHATLCINYPYSSIDYCCIDYTWSYNWITHIFMYKHSGFSDEASCIITSCTTTQSSGFTALRDILIPVSKWYAHNKNLSYLIQGINHINNIVNIKQICRNKQNDVTFRKSYYDIPKITFKST